MFPEEVHALLAKVVFFIFATCLLCFTRFSRADDSTLNQFSKNQSVQIQSIQR